MITLLMLPYFLVARLLVDDNLWLYGPEYTYSAQVSIVNVDEDAGVKQKAFDMSSTLKCRPRVPDTLNCRFDDTGMRFYQQGLADLGDNAIQVWDMSEEAFDIKFDKNGVNTLVVSKDMSPWVIGGLRAIVNQLNFGVDLRNKHDGTFSTIEKSYIGECEAAVRISRRPIQDAGIWNDNVFEIAPMPGLRKDSEEIVEIEKWRNLEECKEKADYFFGSKTVSQDVYKSTLTQMISSVSQIIISDTNYTSYTANEIIVTNKNTGKEVKLEEKITLRLDSIAPDNSEDPSVEKSTSQRIFAH